MYAAPSLLSLFPPALAGGDSMGEAIPLGERRERLDEWVVLLEDEDEDDKDKCCCWKSFGQRV